MAHWAAALSEPSEEDLGLELLFKNAKRRRISEKTITIVPLPSSMTQRLRDFSTLPIEILSMVAEELTSFATVANDGKKKIATELLVFRLVCSTFARVGTDKIKKLFSDHSYTDYTVLHLPPKSGSLYFLKTAVSGSLPKMFVRTVTYHIRGFTSFEVDEMTLHDIYEDDFGHNIGCKLVRKNLKSFQRLQKEQATFVKRVSSRNGQNLLRTILQLLPRLTTFKIHIQEFWDGFLADVHYPDVENKDIAFQVYQTVLPIVCSVLPSCSVSKLEWQGFGSYSLGGLPPAKLMDISKGLALSRITDFHFALTHKDDFDNDFIDEPTFKDPRRADRLNLILHSMTALEHLNLDCVTTDLRGETVPGDRQWLADVLQGQHFPRLSKFSIRNFHATSQPTLSMFLEQHRAKLRSVSMSQMILGNNQWCELLALMRNRLSLREASIHLGKFSSVWTTHAELSAIVQQHGKGESNGDLSDYVIKAA